MAVGPQRVLARGRPGRVDHARLDDEHVGRVRVLPGGDLRLGRGDLLERAAEVQRSRPAGTPRSPTAPGRTGRSRPCRRPRRTGTWRSARAVPRRQPVAGEIEQGARRDIEQDGPGRAAARRATAPTGRSRPGPAGGDDGLGHGVGDPGAAALDDRPADRVGQAAEQQADRAGRRRGQRQHRVRGDAGEQAAGLVGAEAPGHRRPRTAGRSPNAASPRGVAPAAGASGTEQRRRRQSPSRASGPHQPPVGGARRGRGAPRSRPPTG